MSHLKKVEILNKTGPKSRASQFIGRTLPYLTLRVSRIDYLRASTDEKSKRFHYNFTLTPFILPRYVVNGLKKKR